MDLGLKGKKAIVTGASRGIGLSIAEALADEGVDLAICARGAEGLEASAKALVTPGFPHAGSRLASLWRRALRPPLSASRR